MAPLDSRKLRLEVTTSRRWTGQSGRHNWGEQLERVEGERIGNILRWVAWNRVRVRVGFVGGFTFACIRRARAQQWAGEATKLWVSTNHPRCGVQWEVT